MMTEREIAKARVEMAGEGYAGPFHEHDGYQPHSHEVRPDHLGVDLDPCHLCGGESDGTCAICDRPVCDDDARSKDHDRFCRGCAPSPATATEG